MKTSTLLLASLNLLPCNKSETQRKDKKGVKAPNEFVLLQSKARLFSGIHLRWMYKCCSSAVGFILWKRLLCACVNDTLLRKLSGASEN